MALCYLVVMIRHTKLKTHLRSNFKQGYFILQSITPVDQYSENSLCVMTQQLARRHNATVELTSHNV